MLPAESNRSYQVHVESVRGLMSVLRWENPVKSATVFIECLVILFLIQNGDILRLFLQLGYIAIGITALTEFITKFLNGGRAGLVSSFKPSRLIAINKERLQEHSDSLVSIGEELLYWVRRVLDARDLGLTLTAFFATWALYVVTAIAPFSSLATSAIVIAFTVPAIYSRFRNELTHARGHFSGLIEAKYSQVQGQVNAKAGPQLEKIQAARNTLGTIFGHSASITSVVDSTPANIPTSAVTTPLTKSTKNPVVNGGTGTSTVTNGSMASSTFASETSQPVTESDSITLENATSANSFTTHP